VFYFVLFLSLCIFLPSPIFSLFPYTTLFRSICMRFFSEEWREGSMEILLTVPLKDEQIIGGKYLSGIILLFFSLVPTIFYFITIKHFAAHPTNVDTGAVIGSYIGLFFLGSVFTAISTWCSSLSKNTVVAFLLSVFFCFMFYSGFEALSQLPFFSGGLDYYLELLGIDYHYQSISRGVISLQD